MTYPAIYITNKKYRSGLSAKEFCFLAGSQARNQQDRHSDYDLLVITPNALSTREKIFWHSRVDNAIVKAIHAPIDLLLNSEEEVKEKANLPGHIVRSALREGILL
jgi:predicted nucleotidyltransferase